MKILFDENFPKLIRNELKDFTVFTTGEMGWNGIKNGKLLKLMIENEFDCLLTLDKNLEYQQNIQNLSIKILVVNTFDTTYKNILKLVPKIIYTLKNLTLDKVYIISE
ncbi:MAG: DUF5615 family PIN-like protein [Ignavibacteria bacterium]|nr:DUF5615 family PIN-like protein [Ignavibacteria bacterium]